MGEHIVPGPSVVLHDESLPRSLPHDAVPNLLPMTPCTSLLYAEESGVYDDEVGGNDALTNPAA